MEDKSFSQKTLYWNMHYGLPTSKYLDFVRSRVTDDPNSLNEDPFSIDVLDPAAACLVERKSVESEIKLPGDRIVLGANGSGKTMLFRRLHRLLLDDILVVRLPLSEISTTIPETDLHEGKTSILTAKILSHYIFKAYWEHFILNPSRRLQYYPLFRQDRTWTKRFQWFYQRFYPYKTEIPDEFELMAWLNCHQDDEPFDNGIQEEDQLRELVEWVVFKPDPRKSFFIKSIPPLYQNILILVDDAETLSTPSASRLLRDAQRLIDLRIKLFSINLFFNNTWQSLIEEMQGVREGRVAVYRMPEWKSEELRQMLMLRWLLINRGDYTLPDVSVPDIKLGDLMGDALTPTVRGKFLDLIIKNALDCSQAGKKLNGMDAPIHSLKLARAFVAACSGCWVEWGLTLPLDETKLQQLANVYKGKYEEREV